MTADLDGLPFSVVRRGFDRAQVEERLAKLLSERDDAHAARQNAIAERERLARDLDLSRSETRTARAELAEARAEVDRLAGQVAELATVPSTVDGMSNRLQTMVRVAQDEVNDMRTRATRGAAQILGMAQAEADELREASQQERRTFEAEQRRIEEEVATRLADSREQLQALREDAEGRRTRLDAELAERRAQDEQALMTELAERRDALLTELAGQEKRQRDEAQRIVDAASVRARGLVADAVAEADRERSQTREQVARAGDELDQLRALQHQVAEQLSGVRSLLDWTLPRISTAGGAEAAAGPRAVASAPFAALGSMPSPPVAMAPEGRRSVLGTAEPDADEDSPRTTEDRPAAPVYAVAEADGAADAVADDAEHTDAELAAAVPAPRATAAETPRPSPVARSGHRAGSRR